MIKFVKDALHKLLGWLGYERKTLSPEDRDIEELLNAFDETFNGVELAIVLSILSNRLGVAIYHSTWSREEMNANFDFVFKTIVEGFNMESEHQGTKDSVSVNIKNAFDMSTKDGEVLH